MLVHADRDDFVEHTFACDIAMVALFDSDSVDKSSPDNTATRFLDLTRAQCHSQYLRAIVPRGIDRKASPTAADIEQAFAWYQTKFAADVIQFNLLRLVDIFLARREISAGIDQAPVEPQCIKVVRNVIMVAAGGRIGGGCA